MSRRSRARQGEKAGCFTDRDGYKRHPDNTSTWQSGRGSGQLLPSATRWPTRVRYEAYPLESKLQEFLLMSKAVSNRWAIPEEVKGLVIERMSELLMAEPELAVGAARILVQCEKQNQDDRKRRRAREARVQIANIINTSSEAPAPDPDYIRWKQLQLLEQQIKPSARAVAEGQDQPEEPVALLPGGEPLAPAGQLSSPDCPSLPSGQVTQTPDGASCADGAIPAPLAGAMVKRKARLLI